MDDDDERLLERIQQGDGESFGVLYDRTWRWLLSCVVTPRVGPEAAEAESLRQMLDSGARGDAAGEASFSAVALLEACRGEIAIDELAVRRLRNELIVLASRRKRRPFARVFLQVAAAALVAALLAVGRVPRTPSAALLAEREAEAREAVGLVATSASVDSISRSTLASLTAGRTEALFADVESERLANSSAEADSPSSQQGGPATPIPGGAS